MTAKVYAKGQLVIPEAIRTQARLQPGDEVDVGLTNGLIVLRKRQALSPEWIRRLLRGGRALPELTAADEQAVAEAISRVRRRRVPAA
jgi:AbrB family looped-hinge helix DNA binding protein